MNTVRTDRRRKIVYVDEGKLFSLIFCNQDFKMQFLTLPVVQGLPLDVIIHGVYYDLSHAAFAFVIGHESFEEAAPGCLYPVMDVEWRLVDVAPVNDRERDLVSCAFSREMCEELK